MKSIKKDIVRSVTITTSVIIFSVFMAIDIVLDDWVQNKFNESLTIKANYLKSLIKVKEEGVEFDFAGEFMPEFALHKGKQYFQLWIDGKPFERSESLQAFPEEQLAKVDIAINSTKFINVTLPDGRNGIALMSYFTPQIPSNMRNKIYYNEHAVFFTIAISNDEFSNALIALDVVFWLVFFTFIAGVRYLVIFQIDKGLKPLNLLNQEVAHLKVDKSNSSLKKITDEHIEVATIRAELSRFIEFSQATLEEEQRLSADIAHELKTPISEIISLSELNIQYPDDMRISESYSQDMLSIALRMEHIVSNLMMLNQGDEYLLNQQNEDIILLDTINDVLLTIGSGHENISERVQISNLLTSKTVNLDIVSFNIIMSNLINNALFYSPAESIITLQLKVNNDGVPQITLNNELTSPISDEQLNKIFKPLYRIDKSRSEKNRYGLGLSIVKKLCVINNYDITVSLPQKNYIQFTLSLNKFK